LGGGMAMKRRDGARAVTGLVLFVAGMLIALPTPYRERSVVFGTGGCGLYTTVLESKTEKSQGTVLLLHGLAANKKIMSYTARGFAAMNLRVVVPDLPGHGRTPGPFSPERAEQCSMALLQDLFVRGMAQPDTTIIAGHSMGAAIALRLGEKQPVAGLVAISPAPMLAAHGAPPEALLLTGAPTNLRNALVLSGQFEPESMRANAADLVSEAAAVGSKYEVAPRATHVSLIFDPRVVRLSQQWVTQVLRLDGSAALPSRWPLLASIAGFAGILLIAGPFLREIIGEKAADAKKADVASPKVVAGLLWVGVASLCGVGVLYWWNPLHKIRIFEGDYLAALILLVSVGLLVANWRLVRGSLSSSPKVLASAIVSGVLLLLLVTGWFELTLTEAWLNASRWARFPFLLTAVLPYHFAEELFLGPTQKLDGWRRLAAGLSFRLVAWLAILAGLHYLHSGEILLALLAPYFMLLCALQRLGMDIVRRGTGSATAAAIFGAILLAGFCLVIFPVT
jgi:pimeloyl-ACP methyl ester carboxylesterase